MKKVNLLTYQGIKRDQPNISTKGVSLKRYLVISIKRKGLNFKSGNLTGTIQMNKMKFKILTIMPLKLSNSDKVKNSV